MSDIPFCKVISLRAALVPTSSRAEFRDPSRFHFGHGHCYRQIKSSVLILATAANGFVYKDLLSSLLEPPTCKNRRPLAGELKNQKVETRAHCLHFVEFPLSPLQDFLGLLSCLSSPPLRNILFRKSSCFSLKDDLDLLHLRAHPCANVCWPGWVSLGFFKDGFALRPVPAACMRSRHCFALSDNDFPSGWIL